jgi:hypothetical protein
MQEGKNYTQIEEKDVLSGELEASPGAYKSS